MPSLTCRMASTELFSSSRSWLMIRAVCGYFLQPRLEPERAFEVEIVGRFVEQQQVGLGEQRGRQRHPHPPAAGELRHRPGQVRRREAQAAQDLGGAGRGRDRRRSRSGGRRCRPCRSGSARLQLEIRASRSSSAARTVSSSGTGVAGCSWSTEPMRAPSGSAISPPPAAVRPGSA